VNLSLTATNGPAPDDFQLLMLTVNEAPAITNEPPAGFVVGLETTFTITTSGFPAPALTETGSLPSGISFTDNGDGTATLSGTPDDETAGAYVITITASNGINQDAVANYILSIDQVPDITSTDTTQFVVGDAATFQVTTTGSPSPSLS